MTTLAENIADVQALVTIENAALESATDADERAEHEACLEHFNRVVQALEAVQASPLADEEKDGLSDIVILGAAVGLLDDEEGLNAFKSTVLEPMSA